MLFLPFFKFINYIHPKWDNGRTLGVIPNVDDFRKLTESEIEAEKMDLQSEENDSMKMNL